MCVPHYTQEIRDAEANFKHEKSLEFKTVKEAVKTRFRYLYQTLRTKNACLLFDAIMRDRAGFLEFVAETSSIFVDIAKETNLVVTKRLIHTIKGNCGAYGTQTIADYCHNWETELAESNDRRPSTGPVYR